MKRFAAIAFIPALVIGDDLNINQFGWLTGCWATPDNSSQEVWVVDSEQSLAGFGVSISGNKVGFYEILSIKQSDQGLWVYTAHPSGQASATFQAVYLSKNSVVFRNPDHDYPQEISYRREGDHLNATISLLGGADPNSFDKVVCK